MRSGQHHARDGATHDGAELDRAQSGFALRATEQGRAVLAALLGGAGELTH
jgi:hypothetical protein